MKTMKEGGANPISITIDWISYNDLQVSASGAVINISQTGTEKYNATVSEQGNATITLSGGGLESTSYNFRTKIIPEPIPTLSGKQGGNIGNGEFKAQRALIPQLENFDFDARCEILSYTLFRIPKP